MSDFIKYVTCGSIDDTPFVNIEHNGNYDLGKTLDCGQAFRWEQLDYYRWAGGAFGKLVVVEETAITLTIYNCTMEDYENIWCHYFALDEDYDAINRELLKNCKNPTFKMALEEGNGIRILHQDAWEAVCSFIISQNNNIPRIKKIIDALCFTLGKKIDSSPLAFFGLDKREFYSFPTPEAVLEAGEELIFSLKTGFRAKYIMDAAERWCRGEINEDELKNIKELDDAIAYLCRVKGIGLKVASCALLFGFERHDPFPVDVWMKRVLDKYFEKDFDPRSFGRYAGIAQQYLFDYERNLDDQ